MASFNSTVITTKGHTLIAKIVAGTASPTFTQMKVSDTDYSAYTQAQKEAMATISSVKQSKAIASVSKVNAASVKVSAVVDNIALATGYYLKTIGLYATDPTEGEILYSVTTAIQADWIPPNTGISVTSIMIDLITVVSNSDNVSVSVDPNATATVQMVNDLNDKVSDLQAFIGYTDVDIFGVEVDFVSKTFTRLAGAVNKTAGAMFDNIKAFGGRKRCNVSNGGMVLAYYGDAAYTETGALLQAVTLGGITYPVGEKVQVMVEQPRFYYKVVPLTLEPVEYKEVNTIGVTAVPTADGNLTINLDGKNFTVAVATIDNTTTLVATKIRAAAFVGWTTGGSGASVTFTALATGEKVTATFSGGTTGVTATVTKTLSGKVGKGFHMRKARYYVSDVTKTGFKLHPAFIYNGKEKNFIYLSAYEGTVYDTSGLAYLLADEQIADFIATTGDKLSSIAYAKPASGLTQDLTRAKTRILANNRGTGWNQAYAATVSATQLLFAVEYASFNTQSKIGMGVMKADDGATNMSEPTGATTLLGNASGSAANGSISYRGEENFWMNIWKFVDGLNIYAYNENSLYVADHGFADNISADPYKDAGITISRANGYISAFAYNEEFDWLFFASETTGDTALPVGDYLYQNHASASWFIARLGGSWRSSSSGGGFYWSVSYASSVRARSIGGRLVYVPDAA
jgi:hypothetical protein